MKPPHFPSQHESTLFVLRIHATNYVYRARKLRIFYVLKESERQERQYFGYGVEQRAYTVMYHRISKEKPLRLRQGEQLPYCCIPLCKLFGIKSTIRAFSYLWKNFVDRTEF